MEMNATSSGAPISLSATTTTTMMSGRLLPPNGEEIQQEWNFVFVLFAYSLSFVASYAAVHLLDHTLWRTEEEHKVQMIQHPRMWCSIILGFGAVWSMHFVGMAAVTLQDGIYQCYNWPITLGSMIGAIICIYAGLTVASYDIFAGPDRLENLKTILISNRHVTHEKHSSVAISIIQCTVLFHKIHHIITGGIIAAIGAIVMHYTGMMAVQGPFRMEFDILYVVLSVILSVVICVIGFWILLRLRWKAKQFWLRYVSAAVLAFAISFLHFFGMLSVTYIADDTLEGRCQTYNVSHQNEKDESFANLPGHSWTTHQQIVVGVSLTVPIITAIVENLINQELLLAYRIKADPDFAKLFGQRSSSHTDTLRQRSYNNSTQGKIRISGLHGYSHDESIEHGTTQEALHLPSKITESEIDMEMECGPPSTQKDEETKEEDSSSEGCYSCEKGKQNPPRFEHFSMVGGVE